jgi:DNA-binding MarR family transcriptional regulator
MRERGKSIREIARELKVSPALVHKTLSIFERDSP